jgi:hypothetical protein
MVDSRYNYYYFDAMMTIDGLFCYCAGEAAAGVHFLD